VRRRDEREQRPPKKTNKTSPQSFVCNNLHCPLKDIEKAARKPCFMNIPAKKIPPAIERSCILGSGKVMSGPALAMANHRAPAPSSSTMNTASPKDSNKHHGMASIEIDEAVSNLFSAIDMLPESKKSSFLKAKEKCPDLIAAETTPALFLQHDKQNYWKAAERLAMHWDEREKTFGERAFLPMTQTGNGALSKEDIVTLHTGSHARLKETRSGQPVIFTDRRRILPTSERQSRARCFWYMVFMMAKEKNAQTRGVLFLVLLVTPRLTSVDFTYMKQGINILNLMPATYHMHLLAMVSKSGKWGAAQSVIQSVVSYCLEAFGGHNIYTETEKIDLLEKLKTLGCEENGLPSSVGGSWKYEEYTKWCRNKITDELYLEDAYIPKDKPQRTGNMTVERKRQRTKCLNVIHSRQKRERRKAEQIKMEEDCEKLQKHKWALQHENKRLGGLLEQARAIIEPFEAATFHAPVSMTNSYDPLPSNTFSSTPHIQTVSAPLPIPIPQTDQQMQAMLMNALAMQQRSSQQSQPSNQGLNQQNINQHSFQLLMNQQAGQSRSSNSQHVHINNQGFADNQYAGLNFAAEQALVQAMGIPEHNRSQSRDANFSNPSHMNAQFPNRMTSTSPDNAPSPLGDPDIDPFAPLDAHIDSMVASAPATGMFSMNQATSLRESVPQEFANFEIPEPDPLPETPAGFPTYQTRHRHFHM